MNPTKRILIADDEPHMAHVIELFLKREGFHVDLVRDGQEAIDSIMASAPDVLITDIQMPRMTGQELCMEIEKRLPERAFRIIVMTSMTDHEHRDWSSQLRNAMFMEKPVSMRALVTTLSAYFAERAVAGGTAHG
jgi:DNA-binding response OmpR family regulator